VSTCLAKNPDDRFQTAHDVRLDLKWIAEVAARLEPQRVVPPSKTASRILLWTMASLGVIALFFGGTSLVKTHDNSAVRYTRVTYREGNLQAARFSRDGQTIVYSGGWEGEPPQVAIARLGSPESRPLGIPPAGIAAVSSSDTSDRQSGGWITSRFDGTRRVCRLGSRRQTIGTVTLLT